MLGNESLTFAEMLEKLREEEKKRGIDDTTTYAQNGSDGLGDAVLWQTIPVFWSHPGGNYRTILCELFPSHIPQLIQATPA